MSASYRPDIDGLRAIAVLSVLVYHIDHSLLRGGYLGVDIFFVISGYLISQMLFKELDENRFTIVSFYERRARRILPALFVVLLCSAAVASIILPPRQLIEFSQSLVAAMGFVANIFFWFKTNYFAEPAALTPLLHTWSLSVEEQFYILFPLMLAAIAKYFPRFLTSSLLIVTVVATMISYNASQKDPNSAFYLFQYRAWELLVGGVVARIQPSIDRRWYLPEIGLTLLAISLLFLDGKFAFFAVAGTALIIAGRTKGPAQTVLEMKPLVQIGLMSYSLYLWHQPVFALSRSMMINAPTPSLYAALSAACFGLSYLTLRFVERPARDRRLSTLRFTKIVTAFGSVTLMAALAPLASDGFPGRFTQEQIALLNDRPERNVATVDGRTCRRTDVNDACIIGDQTKRPSFAVLGDSHAEALTGPLSDMFKKRHLSAYSYTYPACPFIRNVGEVGTASPCPAYVERVISKLKENHIQNVVINDRSTAYILGTRFDNKEGGVEPGQDFPFAPIGFKGTQQQRILAMSDALVNTLTALINSGVRVFYIAPIPEAGWNVPRTMLKAASRRAASPTTNLDVYLDRHAIVLDAVKKLARSDSFIPIYPHDTFCSKTSRRCRLSENSSVLYSDTDHLSSSGARKIVDELAPYLEK